MTSPELNLVILCCRKAFSGVGDIAFERNAGSIDWALFLRLVRFHRVQGLVWSAVDGTECPLPPPVAEAIAGDAETIAADNLRSALECAALHPAFQNAGVPLLFVKGLTLGALAYGAIGVKAAVDIDLLVPEDGLVRAAKLLERSGYRLADGSKRRGITGLPVWHRAGKESTWIRERDRIQVDLHTRLADHRQLIPTLGVEAPRQLVEVAPGISLPTLAREELFAYLCVHGGSSAWFRLKWITDLAALVHRCAPGEIELLYRRSQVLGAGRAAGQALLLADALFETLAGNVQLRDNLARDPATRWLFRGAMRQLAGRRDPREPTSRPLGTALIHLTQLLLLPGLAFPLSEAVRQVRAAAR